REFAAVLTARKQLEATAHWPRMRIGLIARAETHVTVAEPIGNQHFDRLSHELVTQVTKQHFGLAVDDLNATRGVDDDDRIRSGLEQAAELGFRCRGLRVRDLKHGYA